MNRKTSFTFALAVLASAFLASTPAQAYTPSHGARAMTTGGGYSGGEGSVQATAESLPGYFYVDATASARLSDGTLGGTSYAAPCPLCYDLMNASSYAMFWDTVTFHNAQGAGQAQLKVSIDGTMNEPHAIAWANFYAGPVQQDFFYNQASLAPAVYLDTGSTVLTQDLALLPGDTTVFIYAALSTDSVAWPNANVPTATADFANGLRFSWTLPAGVTATSASGQFMTSAVPEPGSLALLAGGLCVLGAVQRRSRTKA